MPRKIILKFYDYGEPVPDVGKGYHITETVPVYSPQHMGQMLTTLQHDSSIDAVRVLMTGNDKASIMQFIASSEVRL